MLCNLYSIISIVLSQAYEASQRRVRVSKLTAINRLPALVPQTPWAKPQLGPIGIAMHGMGPIGGIEGGAFLSVI